MPLKMTGKASMMLDPLREAISAVSVVFESAIHL